MGGAQVFAQVSALIGVARPKVENLSDAETARGAMASE